MKKFVLVAAVSIAAMAVKPATASAQRLFSGVGGVCLNVEGGVIEGARIIGWPCQGGPNEKFVADGKYLKLQGTVYCIASDGRAQGAQLRLRKCTNDMSTQNFAMTGTKIGHNTGLCVDLSGQPGLWKWDGHNLINQDGNGIVAQGGGNIVAQGGGNLVSISGGNLISISGGNLVTGK